MEYKITSNTKNIGKRNIYFNKPLTIKLIDGIIEKQYDIKPGESMVIIVDDRYKLPWAMYDLEKNGLLKISIINNNTTQYCNNEIINNDNSIILDKEPTINIEPIVEDLLPVKNKNKKNKQTNSRF